MRIVYEVISLLDSERGYYMQVEAYFHLIKKAYSGQEFQKNEQTKSMNPST